MAHFDYDGFRISYEQRRRGAASRPVVLVHGLLFPRTHNYPLADLLAAAGNRVVLIDLLGHGDSDKPAHSRYYNMELFALQVVALLDHLDIPEAVVGGTSLGANVSLEMVSHSPDRIRGLFVDMPVLERAAPVAGLIFLPLLIAYAQGAGIFHLVRRGFDVVPRGSTVYADALLEVLAREPEPSAAVLHGLLAGRIAPHPADREKMEHPALIIGHRRDVLHPFSDAEALQRELRHSELVQARSFFELRFPPNRLSDRLIDWLDEVWG
ncbi:MAG: alpha/beta fold hydrolase [Actinomycetota bacterium]